MRFSPRYPPVYRVLVSCIHVGNCVFRLTRSSASDGVGAEFSDKPFSEVRSLGTDVCVTIVDVDDGEANVRPITTVPVLDVVISAVEVSEIVERDGRLSDATPSADPLKGDLRLDSEDDEVIDVSSRSRGVVLSWCPDEVVKPLLHDVVLGYGDLPLHEKLRAEDVSSAD